jgi:hypothetical protein
MRVAIFIFLLLGLAGFLIADGIGMYGARQAAADFTAKAAARAVQTYEETGGSEVAVQSALQMMAVDAGVELVDVSYHKGTTRWYEVTARVVGTSYFLRHLPVIKDHLVQESRAVAHF